jgi:AMMECR1 domain-containing protein
MFHPKTLYAKIAFDTILFYKTTGQIRKTEESKITPDLKLNLGCIVYIYDSKDTLISYFGNVYPQKSSLYEEIISNAVIATDSSKNEKLTEKSMEQIKVIVDVLSLPHKVENVIELQPHKQGIFIKDNNGKSGFVLPNEKGIKTGADQLKIAKKQAGLDKKDDSEIEIMSFKITRYD